MTTYRSGFFALTVDDVSKAVARTRAVDGNPRRMSAAAMIALGMVGAAALGGVAYAASRASKNPAKKKAAPTQGLDGPYKWTVRDRQALGETPEASDRYEWRVEMAGQLVELGYEPNVAKATASAKAAIEDLKRRTF